MIAHAPTPSIRRAAFAAPGDRLDPAGERAAAGARRLVRRVDGAVTSPAVAARRTAALLGLDARAEAALREVDYGRWAGRMLDEVAATEPDAVAAWLSDPAAAPHGGESLLVLLERVAAWLSALEGSGHLIAVTHSSVLRGAVLAALHAPPAAFWHIEAGPLGRVRLRGDGMRWVVLGLGAREP